jgi:hypothetical protein
MHLQEAASGTQYVARSEIEIPPSHHTNTHTHRERERERETFARADTRRCNCVRRGHRRQKAYRQTDPRISPVIASVSYCNLHGVHTVNVRSLLARRTHVTSQRFENLLHCRQLYRKRRKEHTCKRASEIGALRQKTQSFYPHTQDGDARNL